MSKRIPNLWKMKLKVDDRDPGTLYRLYFCQLMLQENHDRLVEACRIIRRYGMNGQELREWLFTFEYEVDSLIWLGRLDIALRQVRSRDRAYYGHCDYARLVWKEDSGMWPIYKVAPLHYCHGQFELGCHILEAALEPWFKNNWQSSYYWFRQIAISYKKPNSIYQFTLAMFYDKLGKDLRDWKYWDAFIDGFPDQFYNVLKIGKEALRDEPKLLGKVISRIGEIQKQNRPFYSSGGGDSIEDIIETPRQIKKRHDQFLRKRHETQEAKQERTKNRRLLDQRLVELFPEVLDNKSGVALARW